MRRSTRSGFTLVEVLVSTVVVILLVLILVSITGQASTTWQFTTGKIEQFRGARNAFETITTRLAQATLNTYWDYDNPVTPSRYERRSELRFISGRASTEEALLGNFQGRSRVSQSVFFHAPLGYVENPGGTSPYKGLGNLLNVWGYYVELHDDEATRPAFLGTMTPPPPPRHRFRLMEFMLPAEQMQTYRYTSGIAGTKTNNESFTGREWFEPLVNSPNAPVHVLAENIIALVIKPQLTRQDQEDIQRSPGGGDGELAPNYFYDSTQKGPDKFTNSKNQLPPVLQVTVVAIDEQSAVRLNLDAASRDVFGVEGKFQNVAMFKKDLERNINAGDNASLENKLTALNVNYRVFTTNVPIRAAKWSREQKDIPQPPPP